MSVGVRLPMLWRGSTFPWSRSCRMAAAVNCLVMEPMAKTASARMGASDSTSALPYGARNTVSAPRTMPTTAPTVRSLARLADTMESSVAAGGVRGCAASGDAAAIARSTAARERRVMGLDI